MTAEEKTLLKQEFIKRIENQENLKKKYGFFAPYVLRYLDGVLEVCDNVSPKIIDTILGLKVHIREGMESDFKNRGASRSVIKNFYGDLNNISKQLIVYTLKEEYDLQDLNNNFEYRDYALANFINMPALSFDELEESTKVANENKNNYFRKMSYIITFIHELNHLCSNHINVRDVVDSKDVIKIFQGGINLRTFYVDKQEYIKDTTAAFLHEGITELLAYQIFHSSPFDDIELNHQIKINKKRYRVVYKPFYRAIQMLNISQNGIFTKCYFADTITKEQENKIVKIIETFRPIVNSLEALQKIDTNTKFYELQVKGKINRLIYELVKFSKIQMHQVKANKLFLNNSEIKSFDFYNNYFLNPETWKNEIYSNLKDMKNEDKDKVYQIFNKKMEKMISYNNFFIIKPTVENNINRNNYS